MRWCILMIGLVGCPKPAVTPAAVADDSAATTLDPRCENDGIFPIGRIPTKERWFAGVTNLAKVNSSPDRPVEVCGVKEQLRWLFATQCPGGAAPFDSLGAAHGARIGSFGGGGRCSAVLDKYVAPCPEGPVTIYLDLYSCPEGRSPMD